MAFEGGFSSTSDELALATRAAWLYHAGGLTQSQVAQALGVPSSKAHRLIARAARAGLVRVLIEGPMAGCLEPEADIARRYELRICRVVPSVGETGVPLRALGNAAASFLYGVLARDDHRVIGVGHGRTLGAAADLLPGLAAPNACFVSLLGGVTRHTGTSPFDVIHRLAEKTGAEAWMMPVPFLANRAEDRAVLLAQRGIAEAVSLAAQATLSLVGVGEVGGAAFLAAGGVVTGEEVEELLAAGAVGEVLGQYFDASGALVPTPLHDRVIAVLPEPGEGRLVVAVAGGPSKIAAIRAVLRSGMLSGLITDEPTAQRLLADDIAPEKTEGTGEWTRKPGMSSTVSLPAGSAAAS